MPTDLYFYFWNENFAVVFLQEVFTICLNNVSVYRSAELTALFVPFPSASSLMLHRSTISATFLF